MAYQEEGQMSGQGEDDIMSDDIPEEEDLQAMVASYEQAQEPSGQRPSSLCLSDDEYDDLFNELMAQDSPATSQPQQAQEDEMDIMQHSQDMKF